MRILGLLLLVCASLSLLTGTLAQDVGSIVTKQLFEQMLKHHNDANCPARGFYSYEAFIQAAKSFPAFGTAADINTRKREIAAFLAQTSQETSGGWATAPDGPYAWGYSSKQEQGSPPVFNFNYGPAWKAIGVDLLANPDLVATDPVVSFKTAFWYWMTPLSSKPSAHDVITGRCTPSATDRDAGRVPGYGAVTNVFNRGIECGKGSVTTQEQDRIGFYKRYCDILGVGYGDILDCAKQKPFA